ncbi:hypothetical protein P8452_23201 [Trifolium repens]|nr:hypothetical protein P8452_23201 [Trifolium repens]
MIVTLEREVEELSVKQRIVDEKRRETLKTYTSPQNRTNNSKNPNSLSKVVRSIQRDFCFCNPVIFVI